MIPETLVLAYPVLVVRPTISRAQPVLAVRAETRANRAKRKDGASDNQHRITEMANSILTISMITREAIELFVNSNAE